MLLAQLRGTIIAHADADMCICLAVAARIDVDAATSIAGGLYINLLPLLLTIVLSATEILESNMRSR